MRKIYKCELFLSNVMVKIDYKNFRWLYWPFNEDQFINMQKPASILLRIKIIAIVLFFLSAFLYFGFGQWETPLILVIGGLLGLIVSFFYYKAVVSGRITIEK